MNVETYEYVSKKNEAVLEVVIDRGYETCPAGEFHQGWWKNGYDNSGRCVLSVGQSCPAYGEQVVGEKSDLKKVGEYL